MVRKTRWKAHIFLNPHEVPKNKELYGFPSIRKAPIVELLKPFEDRISKLFKNIKFGREPNHFQKHLKRDQKRIEEDSKVLIKGDKSNNYFRMDSKDYENLVEKEINKEYRKAEIKDLENADAEQKKLVLSLDLEDRVFENTELQCFATLKDHKQNFHGNPKVRTINPFKCEIGKVSKQILEKLNKHIRKHSGLNQWVSTSDVVDWFEKLNHKNSKKFIKFDVVSFYPSITEELLRNAIQWARKFTEVSEKEENIIIDSKKSFLFNKKIAWVKKGSTNFDVAQGSYDGAECAELVGLFILEEISKIDKLEAGLYRDDGLGVTSATPRQTENIKKKISQIFQKHGLGTTSEANVKVVDFLDVVFDLENGSYKPYMKPNNTPQYVHKLSNHPPSILKNIPQNVNKRLSSISSSEEIFNAAAPPYQKAIDKSGYDYKLQYEPTPSGLPDENKKRKNRKRKVI